MRIGYSGAREVKDERSVVLIDPYKGFVRFISKITHRFKIAAKNDCGSLVSFIRISDTVFVSVNRFVTDFPGRYVIKLKSKDDLIEHKMIDAEVSLEPVVKNVPEDVEEWRYEAQT